MRDIGKACGEKWKTMTYQEKVKYYDIATGKRAEFDKAMAEYIEKRRVVSLHCLKIQNPIEVFTKQFLIEEVR